MKKGFVAYSKADSEVVRGLIVHLQGLSYAGSIEIWYDRNLAPGEEWDPRIRAELAAADVVVFCVSADLLANEYVQQVEIPKATSRHDLGDATVIPVILRPCTWQRHALGKFQAIPAKDGTVQDYVRLGKVDDVWTEVATAVHEAAQTSRRVARSNRVDATRSTFVPQASIRRGADPLILADHGPASDLEKDDFTRATFDEIETYFDASLANLENANPGCKVRMREFGKEAFEASVYVNGQRRSHCGVFIASGLGRSQSIAYSMEGVGERNSYNEILSFSMTTERPLKWQALMSTSHPSANVDTSQMSPQEAAAYLWTVFSRDLRR